MRPKPFVQLLVSALIISISVSALPVHAIEADCDYFEETGHYVCGQFLAFFRSRGGLEVFGYPLTEVFSDDAQGGLHVQYFQRARMELHPQGSNGRVMLGPLIDELGYSFPPADPDQIPQTDSASHRFFPETEHVVSYPFLEAFRKKGGLEIFGYPRSEMMYENGTVVQYFQRARMEWHPDQPGGSEVTLTNVGELMLERIPVPHRADERQSAPPRLDTGDGSRTTDRPRLETCDYFPVTGHWVCDQFLAYFREKGGLEIFGQPLTKAFFDQDHAWLWVQYFERARMELHPGGESGQQVLLGLLGDELGYDFPPAAPDQIPSTNTATHHYFRETGHVVSYAFLDAFRSKGGLEIFGYPRSEMMYEGGHVVQYFQRARLVWRPTNPPDEMIELTDLGTAYLETHDVLRDYRLPEGGPGGDPVATEKLELDVIVEHAVIGPGWPQTVHVYVYDAKGDPVPGASVAVRLSYPGREMRVEMPPSDGGGYTADTFELFPGPPGQTVFVHVTATDGRLSGSTRTSFFLWH